MKEESPVFRHEECQIGGEGRNISSIDFPKVSIFTDGACKGNPGVGGWAAVLLYRKGRQSFSKEIFGSCAQTTNNQMELLAVIEALENLENPCDVTIYSDSRYVVDGYPHKKLQGFTNKPVKNSDLWKRLIQVERRHKVRYIWVKGHAGNKYNERCDALATKAVKELQKSKLTFC